MRFIPAVLILLASGCSAAGDANNPNEPIDVNVDPGSLPLQLTVTAAVQKSSGPVTITTRIRNDGPDPVTVLVACTPIQLERNDGGIWKRIEDLRLCAPPDRTSIPGKTTIEVPDVRLISAGKYRVTVESPDGRQAHSAPFTIAFD